MRKISLLFFVLAMLCTKTLFAAYTFSGGSGTAAKPFQIKTAKDLDSLRSYIGSSKEAVHFRIMNDIDLTTYLKNRPEGWNPIGTRSGRTTSFYGKLHGGGHKIIGFRINRPTTNNIGLFGFTTNAEIDSLGIELADNDSVCGKDHVAILIGEATTTKITACHVHGKVVGIGNFAAGLAGYLEHTEVRRCYADEVNVFGVSHNGALVSGVHKQSLISECYATGNIKSSNEHVGGLIGCAFDGSIIENCFAMTTVDGGGPSGGLIGDCSDVTVTGCYAVGQVISQQSESGGLIGHLGKHSSVDSCYFDAQVSGHTNGVGVVDTGVNAPTKNNIEGKTTGELMDKDTYKGWDFDDIWTIEPICNYPFFQWQTALTKSFNANLKTLTVTIANKKQTLTPAFNQDSLNYIIHVAKEIDNLNSIVGTTVCATAHADNLGAAGLKPGNNIFELVVYAEDPKITKTYTVNVFRDYMQGDGSASKPFLITNAQELSNVRNYLGVENANIHFLVVNDITDMPAYINANYGAQGWLPIGNEDHHLFAKIHGHGHKVTGVRINRPTTDHVGLFGFLENTTIDSLGVEIVSTDSVVGHDAVGAFAGYSKNSTIAACYSIGKVVSTDAYIGGFTGYNDGGNITSCYHIGSVKGANTVGGFIGYASHGDKISGCYAAAKIITNGAVKGGFGGSEMSSSFDKSYFDKEVAGTDVGVGQPFLGSVQVEGRTSNAMYKDTTYKNWDFANTWKIDQNCGYPYLKWQRSHQKSTNNILDSITFKGQPQGIAPTILNPQSSITINVPKSVDKITIAGVPHCNLATVKSYTNATLKSGENTFDLTVTAENGDKKPYTVIVNREIFDGSGTADSPYLIYNAEDLDNVRLYLGTANAGKHFRVMNDIIDMEEYTAHHYGAEGWLPIGESGNSFRGIFHGGGYVVYDLRINRSCTAAGLFGVITNATFDSLGVEVAAKDTIKNTQSIGASVGILCGVTANSNISNTYTKGTVSGLDAAIGGFIGQAGMGQITNCYAKANVSGSSMSSVAAFVGSSTITTYTNCYVAGKVNGNGSANANACIKSGNVANLFYDSDISIVGNSTVGVQGKTTAQMLQTSTFTSWDFTNIWKQDNACGYPYLKWQKRPKDIKPALASLSIAKTASNIGVLEALTPAFHPDSTTYTVEAGRLVDTIVINAAAVCNGTVKGKGNIRLHSGENEIKIIAYAEDTNYQKVYTITVTREPLIGSGTGTNPFLIHNAYELDLVHNYVGAAGSGKHFRVMNDIIDMAEYTTQKYGAEGWLPIGDENDYFEGIFHGGGHVVYDLRIDRNLPNVGLFGSISGTSIDSLGVEVLPGDSIKPGALTDAGGIFAGYIDLSTISNCYTKGKICHQGGLAGGFAGAATRSQMSNCYSQSVWPIDNTYGAGFVGDPGNTGGFGSDFENCYAASKNAVGGFCVLASAGSVTNCYFDTTFLKSVLPIYDFGGGRTTAEMFQHTTFAGWDFTNVWNEHDLCGYPTLSWQKNPKGINADLASLSVAKTASNQGSLGTLTPAFHKDSLSYRIEVGKAVDTININGVPVCPSATVGNINNKYLHFGNNVFKLVVTAEDTNIKKVYTINVVREVFIGVGTPDNPFRIRNARELNAVRTYLGPAYKNMHFRVENDIVDMDSFTNATYGSAGWLPIGGFTRGDDALGYPNAFQGIIHGGGHVVYDLWTNRPDSWDQGLFGSIYQSKIDSLGIEFGAQGITGKDYVGGMVGFCNDCDITNSYVGKGDIRGNAAVGGMVGRLSETSLIENCYSLANVYGWDSIGGIAGYQTDGQIIKVHASGVIDAESYMQGGLLGYQVDGQLCENSHFDKQISQLPYGIGSSEVDTLFTRGRMTNAMMQDSTFHHWDFNNTWEIDNACGYPRLQWEKNIRKSVNANLSSISVDTLSKVVSSTLTWNVPHTTSKVNISGMVICNTASVKSLNNVALNYGKNTFTLIAVAQDTNYKQSYQVTIRRANAPIVNDPKLDTVIVAGGTLSPAFDPTVSNYEFELHCGMTQAEIFLSVNAGNTIVVDGQDYGTDADVFVSAGTPGSIHDMLIKVENTTDTNTYTILVKNPFDSTLIYQAYSNTLEIINNPVYNGGHSFITNQYQWFANGQTIPGMYKGVLYIPSGLVPGTKYSANVTFTDGIRMNVCPYTEPQNWQRMRVYPNPATGKITVVGCKDRACLASTIKIYNSFGILISTAPTSGEKTEIDISHLQKGSYVIKLNNETATIIKQ